MSEYEKNPWKKVSSHEKYDNPWIRVQEDKVIKPNGQDGIYGTIHFKNFAVGVVPMDDKGNTWLVGQYRYPMGHYSWEIPEGGGGLDVDPLITAKRELKEETGMSAKRWSPLLKVELSNSVSDERGFIFLAEDLEMGEPCPDDTEQLQVVRVPLAEAIDRIWKGEIRDSLSVMGLMAVWTQVRGK